MHELHPVNEMAINGLNAENAHPSNLLAQKWSPTLLPPFFLLFFLYFFCLYDKSYYRGFKRTLFQSLYSHSPVQFVACFLTFSFLSLAVLSYARIEFFFSSYIFISPPPPPPFFSFFLIT